jgi:hypothetical protein
MNSAATIEERLDAMDCLPHLDPRDLLSLREEAQYVNGLLWMLYRAQCRGETYSRAHLEELLVRAAALSDGLRLLVGLPAVTTLSPFDVEPSVEVDDVAVTPAPT